MMEQLPARGDRQVVVLAAGGTGGHLFPAQALAEVLTARGYVIHLMTDKRGMEYGGRFPARELHHIPSATISLSRPWLLPMRAFQLTRGLARAARLLRDLAPSVVVGFGGYPSFPPMIAAQRLKIMTVIHEQNAVIGRANRAVARGATAIATSFPKVERLPPALADKATMTGNPVRASVLAARHRPYKAPGAGEPFNLLVFGGSQGARYFAELMPEVIGHLPHAVRRTLTVVQQCREEDLKSVRAEYERLNVKVQLAPFFADLPERIAAAHLVVARSGASTVAELSAIGRPAVLVPLPHSLESDQLKNAVSFAASGGGWIREQGTFLPADLATFLTHLRYAGEDLESHAGSARRQGRPDAAERLADLVERLARDARTAAKTGADEPAAIMERTEP
jgi:UDP-N-acetylglucosamine--N-acetylmuramyl-(pentapeptide) pyrophosphoryl-undecaprenol N-acetylglucosamine transferase